MPISEVYNEDNMIGMNRFPDKFFDLAIVDPPYGIDVANRIGPIGRKRGQGGLTTYLKKQWDKRIPDQSYFIELFRVSKHQIIWGGELFCALPPSLTRMDCLDQTAT